MRILLGALLLVLVGACGGDGPAAPGADVTLSPGESAESAATGVCAEVRAGIDAFNQGDYDETVARFRAAVPLAEAEAEDTATEADKEAADLLLEAVVFYAELPAEDYLESAQSSPDFARYKAITLGQCASGEPPTEPPGVQT